MAVYGALMDTYLPFDAGPGSAVLESGWRKMARLWHSSGVVPYEALEMAPYCDGTGTRRVKVRTGQVWVNGHFGEITVEKNVDLPANGTGGVRTDQIVARMDPSGNVVEVDALIGTPGAIALTKDATKWEILLAVISVPNAATTLSSGACVDRRVFAGNVPSVRAAGPTGPQSLPNLTHVPVLFNSVELFNTTGDTTLHNPAVNPTRLKAPVAGLWRVSGWVRFVGASAGTRVVSYSKSGALVDILAEISSTTFTTLQYEETVVMAAGDYLEVNALQTSGGTACDVSSASAVWTLVNR